MRGSAGETGLQLVSFPLQLPDGAGDHSGGDTQRCVQILAELFGPGAVGGEQRSGASQTPRGPWKQGWETTG